MLHNSGLLCPSFSSCSSPKRYISFTVLLSSFSLHSSSKIPMALLYRRPGVATAIPIADSTPEHFGTRIFFIPIASAKAQQWRPPDPPKASITNSRGSIPRSRETSFNACSIFSLTTSITPSATFSKSGSPRSKDKREKAALVASIFSSICPPSFIPAGRRPKKTLASVTVI